MDFVLIFEIMNQFTTRTIIDKCGTGKIKGWRIFDTRTAGMVMSGA